MSNINVKQASLDRFFGTKNNEKEKEKDRSTLTIQSEVQVNERCEDDEAGAPNEKRRRLSFNRKYNPSYIRFGFIPHGDEEAPRPCCVVCGEKLCNDAMKPSKLMRHLNCKHPELAGKPVEFFERKRDELRGQQQVMRSSNISKAALRASYKVSLRIAKAKKPFTIAEELIMPSVKDVCREVLGEAAAKKVGCVPLSNTTVARRVDDNSKDMEDQLIERLKRAKYFSLQLDESTDITGLAILLSYVRFEYEGDLCEELLCALELPKHTTATDVFSALDSYITGHGLEWKFCVGICTDGAAAIGCLKLRLDTLFHSPRNACVKKDVSGAA